MTQTSEDRTCRRKTFFASKAKANEAASMMRKRRAGEQKNGQGLALTAYKCNFCHGWHVGKKPDRKRTTLVKKKDEEPS